MLCLGSHNEHGDMWVDWRVTHEQVIMNTWFQHHNIHLYMWCSPGDGVMNQIDNTTIKKWFHNSSTLVKGYPGADGGTYRCCYTETEKVVYTKSADKLQMQLHRSDDHHKNRNQQNINKGWNDIEVIDQLEGGYNRPVSY